MSQSKSSRTHLLSIGTARHVFSHAVHGIVFVHDPIAISDARAYGLRPIVLLVVSVADTPFHWIRFSCSDSLPSICGELEYAWRSIKQLRGPPDALRISHHLVGSLVILRAKLEGCGVRVEVASSSDRKFVAALRSAQTRALHLVWRGDETKPCRSIEQLQQFADLDLAQLEEFGLWQTGQKSRVEATATHLALPVNPPAIIAITGTFDWSPGPWMSAWENNLPPDRQRSFYRGSKNTTWLEFRDERESAGRGEGSELADEGHDDEQLFSVNGNVDLVPEYVKAVMPCWPNGAAELARAAGLTLRELQWYLAERLEITTSVRSRLMMLMGIEPDEYGGHELTGGCVLLAGSLRATIHLYDELSHGGDLNHSVEVVPANGAPDPSWRYLLIEACGCLMSILMVARGGDVANKLDAEHLINFDGLREVPADVYHDIVRTSAKACIAPERNRTEMLSFLRRSGDFLQQHLPSRW